MILIILLIFTAEEITVLRAGNDQAIEKLCREYWSVIFDFIMTKVNRNRDTAEDILSATFIKLWHAVSSLKNNTNIKGWVIRIAHYRILEYGRKRDEDKRKIANIITLKQQAEIIDPIEKIIIDETKTIIRGALNSINPEYKRILIMKHLEGKTMKQIAEALHCTEVSVRSKLHRAKAALKTALNKLDADILKDRGGKK